MEVFYVALFVILVTYIPCWIVLEPLARSKGYAVTYERVIPVVNLIAVAFYLVVPRRSPTRRLVTPKEQNKKVRVIRPDQHGRYR